MKSLSAARHCTPAERQLAVKNLLEQSTFLFRGCDFTITVATALHLNLHHPAVTRTPNVSDPIIVPAIHGDGLLAILRLVFAAAFEAAHFLFYVITGLRA